MSSPPLFSNHSSFLHSFDHLAMQPNSHFLIPLPTLSPSLIGLVSPLLPQGLLGIINPKRDQRNSFRQLPLSHPHSPSLPAFLVFGCPLSTLQGGEGLNHPPTLTIYVPPHPLFAPVTRSPPRILSFRGKTSSSALIVL